jgi:hypothetical protein
VVFEPATLAVGPRAAGNVVVRVRVPGDTKARLLRRTAARDAAQRTAGHALGRRGLTNGGQAAPVARCTRSSPLRSR